MLSTSEYRFLPLRRVPLADGTEQLYDRWIAELDEELSDPSTDRNEFCRRVLTDIYFPGGPSAARGDPDSPPVDGEGEHPLRNAEAGRSSSLTVRVGLDQMDPRKITLEPEYYAETDLERYYQVKPLIWLWEMFDKSPMGENLHLGVKFRRILARRIFGSCGRNFKAFHFVKVTFGYGLEVGDDVVVHRHVLLDDRGGIRLGNRASVSDFVNVYSHSHHISEGRDVRTPRTVVGDGVRIAYHATVLAGINLAPNSMIGAGALVTRNTKPNTVYVGVPAKAVTKKPRRRRRKDTHDPLAEPS